MSSTARTTATFNGLTEAEAARRTARGLANTVVDISSRSLGDILKANLLTRFNALLGSMLIVILVVGPLQDAIFGLTDIDLVSVSTELERRPERFEGVFERVLRRTPVTDHVDAATPLFDLPVSPRRRGS